MWWGGGGDAAVMSQGVGGEAAKMWQEMSSGWFSFSFHFSGPGGNRTLPS